LSKLNPPAFGIQALDAGGFLARKKSLLRAALPIF
jgi:hypothetical protein